MAKLNLNKQVVDEMGQSIKSDKTLGQTLAFTLIKSINKNEGEILKYFEWAGKLGKNESLTLDEGDAKILKDFVLGNDDLFVIAKAPILKAVDALKFT